MTTTQETLTVADKPVTHAEEKQTAVTGMISPVEILRIAWEGVVRKSREWLAEGIARSKPSLHGKDLAAWVESFLG